MLEIVFSLRSDEFGEIAEGLDCELCFSEAIHGEF